jgi:hypothetical protein
LRSALIYEITDYKITNCGNFRVMRDQTMQVFHVRYRNSQGALMRILNAVSRRGLDLTSVHAEYAGQNHLATLLLEVTHKQIGQLNREWYAIADVIEVRSSADRRTAVGARSFGLSLHFGWASVSSMNAPWVSVMPFGNLQLECGLLASPQPRVPVFPSK